MSQIIRVDTIEKVTDGNNPITEAIYQVRVFDKNLSFDPRQHDPFQRVNLLPARQVKGKIFRFTKVKASLNTVEIHTVNNELINDSLFEILGSLWDSLTLLSDGVKYIIIGSS